MKKIIIPLILISFFTASCEPVDYVITPVTQIPFYASETPAPFIVPVTDTPIILPPATDTPVILAPATETPPFIIPVTETLTPIPATKWWEVYFTDPLTINNPDVIAGSIEEKLIQYINNAQISIHI